ncbi:hypothetical protein GQ457_04G030950 [Hibiscus cannabinus]
MKLLSWNIRGIGSNLKVSALKKLLSSVRVKKEGNSGGLISIWNPTVFQLSICTILKNLILLEGSFFQMIFPACWQRQTFLNLKNVKQGKWLFEGNFNAVRSRLDRKGCKFKQAISDEFNSFIEVLNLVDEIREISLRSYLSKENADFGPTFGQSSANGGMLWRRSMHNSGHIKALFSGPIVIVGADFVELATVKVALEIFIESKWSTKDLLVVESVFPSVCLRFSGQIFHDRFACKAGRSQKRVFQGLVVATSGNTD